MAYYKGKDIEKSRGNARISPNLTEKEAAETIFRTQEYMGFSFKMIQSVNDAEFQRRFGERFGYLSQKLCEAARKILISCSFCK